MQICENLRTSANIENNTANISPRTMQKDRNARPLTFSLRHRPHNTSHLPISSNQSLSAIESLADFGRSVLLFTRSIVFYAAAMLTIDGNIASAFYTRLFVASTFACTICGNRHEARLLATQSAGLSRRQCKGISDMQVLLGHMHTRQVRSAQRGVQ